MNDPHWGSRVQACLSINHVIEAYPEECKEQAEQVFDTWFKHLAENIPTVRESCAIGLANSLKTEFKGVLEPRIKDYIK